MFATINGVRLHYDVEGTGPALMVISFGGSPIYQRTYSRRLRDHFQMIFVDLRGSGESDIGNLEDLTFDAVLADIDGIRRGIGVEQIAVVGHSAFGLFPLAYAQQFPASAWGAVIISCPPAVATNHEAVARAYWETMASSERKALLADRLADLNDDELARLEPDQAFMRRYVATGPKRFYDAAFDWGFFWDGCSFSMDVFEHLTQRVLAAYDPTPTFPDIACPVFIALGIHDYPTPPPLWHPAKDALPNATYHAFEGSGHWPQYEEQDLFDRKLIAWAQSVATMK